MQEKRKISVLYGNMKLVKYNKQTGEIVEEKWIEKITNLSPILVLNKRFNWYIKGLGVIIETNDSKKYCLQLSTIQIIDENKSKDVIKSFGNRIIINYREYGKLVAFVRGYKVTTYIPFIIFAEGEKIKGIGILYHPLEYEYSGRVPLEICYPYGRNITLKYPSEVKKLPKEKKFKYRIVVTPEKLPEFVDYVEIPDFAIRINQ